MTNTLSSKNLKVRKFRTEGQGDSTRSATAKRNTRYLRAARAAKRSQYSV